MTRPRVCVIGGGALGLASAYFLARKGAQVTVLERHHLAAGSSSLSAGIIETQYIDPLDIELRARAMPFFERLERERGLHVVRNGYLRLARGAEALDAAVRSVEVQREYGVGDARVLTAAEIAELIPYMRCDDFDGGLFGPSDGFIDGHLYCNLLAEMAIEEGASVLVRQCVVEAIPRAGGGHLLRTDRGEKHECDFAINAAGAWADGVARLFGATLALIPQRHQATLVSIDLPPDFVMPAVMDYTPHSGDKGLYFRHERPRQLIAGLHTEEVRDGAVNPDSYGRSADQDFLEAVAEKLLSRLPDFPEAGLGSGWAGIYPMSPDGLPLVGADPVVETLIQAAGAGGSGIQLSPVIGELVADLVISGKPQAVDGAARLLPGRLT